MPRPNSARYSGAAETTVGVPSQQTCPLRQITRSDAAITTCRSWLTISTPQPSSRAELLDQPVEPRLARLVEPLRRLVEHQELRPAHQRLRQQRPLELPARERRELPPPELGDAHPLQRLRPLPPRRRRRAPRKRATVIGSVAVDRELLRHVADPEARRAHDPPRVRPLGADQQAQQRALARAVRPDHGDDLARLERQVDAGEHPVPAEGDAHAPAPR